MTKQRALSVGERIMYVGKHQSVNCLFTVSIRGELSRPILSAALEKLQKKHPLLRSIVCEQDTKPYFMLKNEIEPIPIIEHKRKDDAYWQIISKMQWQSFFDVVSGPLARLIWVKGDEISEIILVCPHCIADGTSMTTLLRELLLLIDDPQHHLEGQPFIEKLSSPIALSGWKKLNLSLKGYVGKGLANILLPSKVNQKKLLKPELSYMIHHRLEAGETKKILRLCKSQGASLYTVVGVSLLKTYFNLFPEKFKGKLICPIDIRKFLTDIEEDQLFAFAPIIELNLDKRNLDAIWPSAKKMKEEINRGIKKINIAEILEMSEGFQKIVPKLINHLLTKDGTHDFTFSNMGSLAIQETFNTFEVQSIYSPSVSFPWRNPNTIVISSYKGILDLTFMSNEAIMAEKEANVFIKTTFETLRSIIHQDLLEN
ncbi:condensation domain-containing protein [Olivibacter domesticus]|uniref:Uncharacterized protein, contains a NRPS condensation (Elongation) domain n=1 Tax=Olivibacter domesticus TaxID=407022 RepID=A0A1H7IZJ9_OLID1|nr:condensation domain-containing protein [Olivibacter domesticus]SEK67818.1 Uncharacterized protein, contains a NRPS condensation (elongation) domain [Olivibacter domesticus]